MEDYQRVRAFIDDLKVNLEALTFDYKGDIIAIKVLGTWVTKNFIVEQCTGLKDINNKLIYHGDRYRIMGNEGIVDRRLAAYWVSLEDAIAAPHKLVEIIGHIHE